MSNALYDATAWEESGDPAVMLQAVRGRVSERKLRLFAAAACRAVWDKLTDPRSRAAVEVAERFANGEATDLELVAAGHNLPGPGTATQSAVYQLSCKDRFIAANVSRTILYDHPEQSAAQAALLRDIVGDPFERLSLNQFSREVVMVEQWNGVSPLPTSIRRATGFAPGWLTWDGGAVPNMAKAIYDSRGFGDLPILADALEDAGCSEARILDHLRGPGPHARGCWVLDLLLGQQ